MTTPAVTVTARQDSRWRCGTEFTASPQSFPAGHWSEEDLERLRADPQLVVSEGGADAHPTTPTVDAALKTALSALRQAPPDRVREFLEAMENDPEIREKIEAAIVDRAAAEANGAPAGEAEPTRQEKAVAAIDELEEGNKAHWTEDGRPDVFVLRKATGLTDFSAAERDAAFEEWKKTAGRELTGG